MIINQQNLAQNKYSSTLKLNQLLQGANLLLKQKGFKTMSRTNTILHNHYYTPKFPIINSQKMSIKMNHNITKMKQVKEQKIMQDNKYEQLIDQYIDKIKSNKKLLSKYKNNMYLMITNACKEIRQKMKDNEKNNSSTSDIHNSQLNTIKIIMKGSKRKKKKYFSSRDIFQNGIDNNSKINLTKQLNFYKNSYCSKSKNNNNNNIFYKQFPSLSSQNYKMTKLHQSKLQSSVNKMNYYQSINHIQKTKQLEAKNRNRAQRLFQRKMKLNQKILSHHFIE